MNAPSVSFPGATEATANTDPPFTFIMLTFDPEKSNVMFCTSGLMLRYRGSTMHWREISGFFYFYDLILLPRKSCYGFWFNTHTYQWCQTGFFASVRLLIYLNTQKQNVLWWKSSEERCLETRQKVCITRTGAGGILYLVSSEVAIIHLFKSCTKKVSQCWMKEVSAIGLRDPVVDRSRQISTQGRRVSGLM